MGGVWQQGNLPFLVGAQWPCDRPVANEQLRPFPFLLRHGCSVKSRGLKCA